ncbi:uncharacterized protein PITG_20799 [Phytophthora infestans T30-4]|uniref:CS domain-containing protein n=1 Tax=Phytophthora infestans (strain T30-4) TaxID=403677 RepID=D0P2Q8_PHYIT|nr:uncharacterized protein PITG_20799 [Phytophthora infestans T30-4]EEY56723.1 conserved hypothetical protein [Phytophthora infestans T30-4]|eukprot:XP_002895419.1 conserved hypothetical protein [Phytophthora infestans T30-4]
MGEGFFVPYLYMPSAGASYMKLVTPWGNIHMNKAFLEQVGVSIAVVVLTVMLWRCAARLNATLKKTDAIKQGEHSYYYTYQHGEGNDGSGLKTMVSSYGWSDHKKTVSIYLADNVVKDMKEDQLVLKWTNTSLSMDLLKATDGDLAKSLKISSLFQEIRDATWKANKDTLTITLTKAQDLPWTSLNEAAKKMEDHIEYDDAFYD